MSHTSVRTAPSEQLSLFAGMIQAYEDSGGHELDNEALYQQLISSGGLPESLHKDRVQSGDLKGHNLLKRKVRWYQQTLKAAGIIEHVPGRRGVWRLTEPSGKGLNALKPGLVVLGFSTNLGMALIGSCSTLFSRTDEPIHLVLSSPPYPLAVARSYGNPAEHEYVDWLCTQLEPVVRQLVPGGSICLNISNSIFMPGIPARSLYRERLVIALYERFGLYKMDDLIWESNKPPGPIAYASKQRVQLNEAYEPILWLTNDPSKVRSDNRRVLQPHTEAHLKFIRAGGTKKAYTSSDGAYSHLKGSYGKETAGRISRNILKVSNYCHSQREYKKMARAAGLPAHGAPMPLALAKFLIEFMTVPGDLVVDMFAGSFTTALAAEMLQRAWIAIDHIVEYVAGGALRFKSFLGYKQAFTG